MATSYIDVDNVKAIIKPTYEYVKPVKKEKQTDKDFASQTDAWEKYDKDMKEKIANWFIDDGKVQRKHTSHPLWQKNAQAGPSNPNQAPYNSQQNHIS